MSALHPASLIPSEYHSAELLQLVDLKIARGLIEHVVQCTAEVVNFALGVPTTSSSRARTIARTSGYSEFNQFVWDVIERAEVTVTDILVTLIYIRRARPYLSVQTEEWALHRVFLGALIVASKYTNDSTLKNIHWAVVTGTFGKRDIGRIEREFIDVLDWDFSVSENDLMTIRESLLHLLLPLLPPAQHTATTPARSETVGNPAPSSPVTSESDSSESSRWSDDDDESDSDSHSTPATSPGPITPSHAAVSSPARLKQTKQSRSFLDAIRHPFWSAPHHPLSVHVVA